MNESTSIGARIAARRKQLGLTQRELAEQMGVTDKAVSKWERDLARPDVQSLPHLADILGLSIETLMDDTPPAMTPSKKNDAPKTLRRVFRGIALAMGIAVVVLSQLHELDGQSAATMLGIGLACLALDALQNEKSK